MAGTALLTSFPYLSLAMPRDSDPAVLVRRMLGAGRLLPLLDGLDELQSQALAISEINEALPPEVPFVVTSRAAEFEQMVRATDNPNTLQGAACIELLRLDFSEIRNYLTESNDSPDLDNSLDHLEEHAALVNALSSPLMLSLAGSIYRADTANKNGDSQELAHLFHFPDETSIERHLLTAFLPSAYRPGSGRSRVRWQLPQAERWFTFIAAHMRLFETRDFAWWKIAAELPSGLLGLLSGVLTGLGLLVTWILLGATHHAFDGKSSNALWAFFPVAFLSISPAIATAWLVEAIRQERSSPME